MSKKNEENISDIIKEAILDYVKSNPNTSPKYLLNSLVSSELGLSLELVAGTICMMREVDKTLIVTDFDEDGHVLLSVAE